MFSQNSENHLENQLLKTDNKRIDALSEEEKREILAIYMEIEPIIVRCLNLNHDINSPLTGIIGYGEFVLESAANLPDDTQSHVEKIMECAERVKKLVDELGDVKQELAERVDIKRLVEKFESDSPESD